ncbi:MAG: permease, partial [Chloroflexota bacterium]
GGAHLVGRTSAGSLMLQDIPLQLFAIIVAGMVQTLIPSEAISQWVGTKSGLRGILIGSIAGALSPGGPYINLPIAAGLMRAGASLSTMVAFLTSWSVISVARLPLEIGIMGWRFVVVRLACSLSFPIIAGLLANKFFSGIHFS